MIVGHGDKRFEIGIRNFEKHMINEVKRIVHETAEIIITNAKALAPSDDSGLEDSIDVTYMKGGLTAYIRVGVHYAIYVEFGTGIYAVKGNGRKDPWVYYSKKLKRYVYTRGMKAQPFWFPALDIGKKHWNKEFKKLG